jgi:hypothetical protein
VNESIASSLAVEVDPVLVGGVGHQGSIRVFDLAQPERRIGILENLRDALVHDLGGKQMGWWGNPDILASWSNVGLFVLTVAVSAFGVWQFYESRRFNREIAAKAVYAEYLRLAFDHPEFANPKIAEVDYVALTFNGDRVQFERYEWFVSFMVSAYEEIDELTRDSSWQTEIEANLRYHQGYFASEHYRRSGYVQNLGSRMARLVQRLFQVP